MDRTEDQIVTQSGFTVQIGERIYELKPLTMRKAMKWRERLSPALSEVLACPDVFQDVGQFKKAMIDAPLQMAAAVQDYLQITHDLTDEEKDLMLDGSEQQFYVAFTLIMGFGLHPILAQRQGYQTLAQQVRLVEELAEKKNSKPPSGMPSTLQ